MGVHWLRRDDSEHCTGVFGWHSVPVIHDVQILSANLTKLNNLRQTAVAKLTGAFAPQAGYAFA